MKTLETNANLQRYTDCPADWCKCECHSLRPEEEEEAEEDKEDDEEEEVPQYQLLCDSIFYPQINVKNNLSEPEKVIKITSLQ